jgi:hypothetical protein
MQDERHEICPPATFTRSVDQESEDFVSIVGYPPHDFLSLRASVFWSRLAMRDHPSVPDRLLLPRPGLRLGRIQHPDLIRDASYRLACDQ